MAILLVMAIPKVKSTYSLDVETVRTLESLARSWNVPKTEVLRRAIRAAAREESQSERSALESLRLLQTSVKARGIDLKHWERELRAERRASSIKRLSVIDDPS